MGAEVASERFVTVDGLTTRTLDAGSGPAVLLVHGAALGCSADDWRDALAPIAAAGLRALAVDQPGFGLCDDPPDVSVAFRARYLRGVLDALSIERATWVGHSQAGRYVVSTALDAPARMTAGLVVCTGSLLPPLGATERDAGVPAREPTPSETRAYLESVVYQRALVTDALVERYQRFSKGKNFACAVRRASERPLRDERPAWERLGEASRPLTFLYGADDKEPVTERVALARERYPQLPFMLLAECGHFAQWDQPAAVLCTILEVARS